MHGLVPWDKRGEILHTCRAAAADTRSRFAVLQAFGEMLAELGVLLLQEANLSLQSGQDLLAEILQKEYMNDA